MSQCHKKLPISEAELQAMRALGASDPGMADLLLKAKEYFVLKGSPNLQNFEQSLIEVMCEFSEAKKQDIMKMRFNI